MPAALLLMILMLSSPAFAEDLSSDKTSDAERLENAEGSIEGGADSGVEPSGLTGQGEEADSLAYTQREKQDRFTGGMALNIGPVMPWSEIGFSLIWPQFKGMSQLSLGAGTFDFSDNYRGRNYLVSIQSQSAYLAYRIFPLGFGPIYVEPFAGFVRWNGSIKPRGFDEAQDQLASSLTSRFDAFGLSGGGNFGLMWIFRNGVFVDYNLLSLSWAHMGQERYSNNTSEARGSIRKQVRGPMTMSALHLRIGWSLDF